MVNVKQGAGIQVFGNSIAAGANADVNAGYINHLAAFIGGSIDQRAVSGSGVKSITQQGYAFHQYGSRTKLCLWDGPLNDIRRYGMAALPAIRLSLDAFLASAFTGGARPASYPQVVKNGPWSTLGDAHGGKAFSFGATPLFTTDAAASMSLTFSGDTLGVHSFATEGGTTYKDLIVNIDGIDHLFELAGKALPGEQSCGAAKIFRDLGGGSHTVTVRPVEAGAYSVVDCFTWPTADGFAPVLVGHIPFLANWPQYGSIATQAIAEAANAVIDEVVGEWKADGFPVEVVPINDFYDPARDCDTDGIHPSNKWGHKNYMIAWLSRIGLVV